MCVGVSRAVAARRTDPAPAGAARDGRAPPGPSPGSASSSRHLWASSPSSLRIDHVDDGQTADTARGPHHDLLPLRAAEQCPAHRGLVGDPSACDIGVHPAGDHVLVLIVRTHVSDAHPRSHLHAANVLAPAPRSVIVHHGHPATHGCRPAVRQRLCRRPARRAGGMAVSPSPRCRRPTHGSTLRHPFAGCSDT